MERKKNLLNLKSFISFTNDFELTRDWAINQKRLIEMFKEATNNERLISFKAF